MDSEEARFYVPGGYIYEKATRKLYLIKITDENAKLSRYLSFF
jgi:hypothetical protein